MTRSRWSLAAAIVIICVSAMIVGGGASALLYVAIYALAGLPGLPLGLILFGARTPPGWITGMLLGYVITAAGIWGAIAAGVGSTPAFFAVWIVLSGAIWMAARRSSSPLVALPQWQPSASAGLGLCLLLTVMLAVVPLARVGSRDASGNQYYRAYFLADFVWHTALTAELAKFTMPPRNPYLASQPIHYYWTYFLFPAAVSETAPGALHDVQRCLKINALLTGALLVGAMFVAAWAAVGRAVPVTLGVIFALAAASAEGTYEVWRLWSRAEPLAALRNTNIDAITAWHFQGHRIDGLPRCLWYVPQHAMAYGLGLVALTVAAAVGSTGSIATIVLCGVALACATAINPFVGGIFAIAWGTAVVLDALRDGAAMTMTRMFRHTLAAAPVGLVIAWCIGARMVEGANNALHFGVYGASLHSPILTLLLSLGPVLVPAMIGALVSAPVAFRRALPAVVLVGMSLLLMYLVRLRVDQEWVPFRAGQMFLVAAPALVGRAWVAMEVYATRALSVGVMAVLFAIGLPTTAIDAYNAQDIRNLAPGPGFHWTLVLDPDEQAVLMWIRRATPSTAVVQMEPLVRDRAHSPGGWGERWSIVPSFGERRMAAGMPISLMQVPEYSEKSNLVKSIYETPNARDAWTIARRLRIGYLYVEAIDRRTYPGTAKFDASPEYFTPAFSQGQAGVYLVK